MSSTVCHQFEGPIALAAIGALDDDGERISLSAHLDGCRHCREKAGSVERVVDLLSHVDASHLDDAEHAPFQLLDTLIGDLRRLDGEQRRSLRRRNRTLRAAVAVAALSAAAAAISILALAASGPAHQVRVALSGTHRMQATALLTPEPWGTDVALSVPAGSQRGVLWVYMSSEYSRPWAVGTFSLVPGHAETVHMSCALATSRVDRLWIEDAGGREVAGGYAG